MDNYEPFYWHFICIQIQFFPLLLIGMHISFQIYFFSWNRFSEYSILDCKSWDWYVVCLNKWKGRKNKIDSLLLPSPRFIHVLVNLQIYSHFFVWTILLWKFSMSYSLKLCKNMSTISSLDLQLQKLRLGLLVEFVLSFGKVYSHRRVSFIDFQLTRDCGQNCLETCFQRS